ncbi:HAD family hydrolase [Frondihabitans sp. 4ASC-45]|uniref:HAD family hydrolase n=1 Tax=Frondihabitans sp. 4ASC-45 TaxID=3111636 RepID=UPI003C1A6851
MTPLSRLLVLDFDGTVCLGDEPVLSYARHIDEALPETERVVESTIRAFLAGPDAVVHENDDESAGSAARHLATLVDAADGYAAAASLARSRGVAAASLSRAYEASRRELAGGLLETWAPAGLADFLTGLRSAGVTVVLVTNATATGVAGQLAHLGLDGVFDEIVTDAGKPGGMPRILTSLREKHGLAAYPERLLSVGDIWRNDLEPAADQKSPTALIERFAADEAKPTFRAPTFEGLYDDIAAWASRA